MLYCCENQYIFMAFKSRIHKVLFEMKKCVYSPEHNKNTTYL